MHIMRKIAVLHIMSFLLLAMVGCAKEKDKPKVKSYPVIQVAQKDITAYSTYPARVEGLVNVEVRPKISGFLEEIFVDEGAWVQEGQRLFKLEARSLRGEAEAAGSAIQVVEANVADAQVEVDRLIPLVEDGIMSEVKLRSAKAKLEAAQSELNRARNSYSSVKENLDYQYVYSAVNGIIGSLPYRQGTLVGMEQEMPLTTVSKIDSVYVYFSMNEKEYFSFLKETQGVSLQDKIKNFPDIILVLADASEYANAGRIQTTTGPIDPETGTATFRAVFPNPDYLLNAGNSGTIKIPRQVEKAILVPTQVTTEEQSKLYVYRLGENDTIRKALIKSTETIDNLVVVQEGLDASDQVLASGLNQVEDNVKIKPKEISFDSLAASVKQVF